jgi:hypothetical protein
MAAPRAHQFSLFTPGGAPFSLETAEKELRGRVLDEFAAIWGSSECEGPCPDCGAPTISVIAHPEAALCRCPCGWFDQVSMEELAAEDDDA